MHNEVALKQVHLAQLSERVSVPSYDRQGLKTGIVHIGVGGFHRAHQAYYTHILQENFSIEAWGICGVGLREGDRKIKDVLEKQDHLFTLLIRHPNGEIETEVIGSLVDFILSFDDPNGVIEKMAQPDTKIVSLTITEGGYNFDTTTGEFDFSNPDVQHELKNPNEPRTVYGYLSAALRKRRDARLPAFTIMSCDNIEHNGDMTRKMLLSFMNKQDKVLAAWIKKEVSFPNTMVDRITPVTTQADIDYLKNTHGILDSWPVTCEPFIQWVIEDKFSNGRPDFEQVGVQFVADVAPYEKMKLRLLNAGHSVLGILGAIHGHKTINACMENKTFATFMRGFLDAEASPVLDELAGINLTAYKDSLETRFANPNIKDSVSRICSESAAKLPKFLIPTLKENLANSGEIEYATLVIAAWCYYCDKAVDRNEKPIEIIDAQKEELHNAAKNTPIDVLSFIRLESIFGNLFENSRFTEKYSELVLKIYRNPNISGYMTEIISNH